jgi:hypothetical protein
VQHETLRVIDIATNIVARSIQLHRGIPSLLLDPLARAEELCFPRRFAAPLISRAAPLFDISRRDGERSRLIRRVVRRDRCYLHNPAVHALERTLSWNAASNSEPLGRGARSSARGRVSPHAAIIIKQSRVKSDSAAALARSLRPRIWRIGRIDDTR